MPSCGLVLADMGQGLPFRGGVFHGAISISAAQWLCYSKNGDLRQEAPVGRRGLNEVEVDGGGALQACFFAFIGAEER